MKKILGMSLLLSCFFSNLSFAQTNCCYPGSWYLELEPFYARLTQDFFEDTNFAEDLSSGCHKHKHRIDEPDRFGFHVALGYDYCNCNPCYYGWSLEFTYIKFDEDANIPRGSDSFGPFLTAPPSISFGEFFQASTDLDTKFYAIDALFHRTSKCSCYFDWQVFAGLRYLKIEEDLNTHFEFDGSIDDSVAFSNRDLHVRDEVDLDGLGLHGGFKANYYFTRCFSITGQIAGDILAGQRDAKETVHFESDFGLTDPLFAFDDSRRHKDNWRAVPGLSGKLGLAYHACFNCQKVSLEGGYRIDHYFNVFEGAHINDPCGCHCSRGDRRSDFEFQGPYLTLNWHL